MRRTLTADASGLQISPVTRGGRTARDAAERLVEAGVTRVVISMPPVQDLPQARDALQRIADQVFSDQA